MPKLPKSKRLNPEEMARFKETIAQFRPRRSNENPMLRSMVAMPSLTMLGTKCAIRFEPLPEESAGGIALPDNPRLREMNGKQAAAVVVAVGAKSKHPDLQPGVRVSVRWGAGNIFEHAGEKLHVINEEEIQAIFE